MRAALGGLLLLVIFLNTDDDVPTKRMEVKAPAELPVVSDGWLWLARAIYSETKYPHEMVLVGWTIRNRVEAGYRGKRSYRGVVLDPHQFSAFNTKEGRRFYGSLTPDSTGRKWGAWQEALSVARAVHDAHPATRPIPHTVLHFYSPVSIKKVPEWAKGRKALILTRSHDAKSDAPKFIRFAFYDKVR